MVTALLAAALVAALAAPVGAQDEPLPTTTTTVVEPPETTTTTTSIPTEVTTSTSTSVPAEGPGPTTTTTSTIPDDEGPDTAPLPTYDPAAIAELLRGYDEAVAEEADLLAQFELSLADLNELNATMVELSARITDVENELLDAETALDQANDRVDLAAVRLDGVERRLAEAQRLLDEQAVDAYIYGGRDPGFYAFLAADSAHQMEATREYASVVAEHTDSVIEEYAALELEAERLREEADDAAREARSARDEVESRRDALEAEREAQARAQADAFLAALAQQDLIDQVTAQRGAYEGRLRTLAGTSDSINGALRDSQDGQTLPDITTGIFLPPLEEISIVSPFGPRLHPIFGTVRMHNGTDFDAAMGTPIRASEDGEVVVAGWQDGYGFTTVIDHGNGLATLYGHQSSIIVSKGERVEMGDVIGLVGSTGWSTGPHLHWEVRVFGNPTDPVPFLGGDELLRQRALERSLEDAGGGPRTTVAD